MIGELIDSAGDRGAVVLAGGCLDIGDGVLPYAPIAEALRVLAGSRDDAELARMLGAAGPYLARLVPELGPAPSRAELESLARRARITLGRPSDGPADAKNSPSEVGAEFHLTKRERQVLAPLADGRTNRQIANTLYISDKTTSVHVSNILSKLGVTNRGQAAAVAHRLGMTR